MIRARIIDEVISSRVVALIRSGTYPVPASMVMDLLVDLSNLPVVDVHPPMTHNEVSNAPIPEAVQ